MGNVRMGVFGVSIRYFKVQALPPGGTTLLGDVGPCQLECIAQEESRTVDVAATHSVVLDLTGIPF